MIPELSMIQALSMEGPALDIEPSAISAPTVEGPALEPRTIHDIGFYRGWSRLGMSNLP